MTAAVLSGLALLSSHADEHVRLIAGEAARVIREREWRDIASAPKDGTRILIAAHDHGDPTKPRHVAIVEWSGEDEEGQGGAWYQEPFDPCSTVWPPTHWQPLPAPAEG